MKLAFGDISGFLKAPDAQARAALIYGPDDGLIIERMQTIGQYIVPDLKDPFNVKELTEEQLLDDPALLADELSAMSLMGGRRLVLLRDASDKVAKTIEEATALGGTDTYLVVTGGELTPKSLLRILFEREGHLAALPCYRDEGRTLTALISDTLRGKGVRFGPEVMAYLTEHLGGDRRATMSELEKIITYLGDEKELKFEDVAELTGHSDDLTLDDFCEAAASADMRLLEDKLARLLREGMPPVMVLRSAMRYFQRLYTVQGWMEKGASQDEALKKLYPPVFFKQLPVFKRHLSLWKRPRLERALARLIACEREVKTGGMSPELLTRKAFYDVAAA